MDQPTPQKFIKFRPDPDNPDWMFRPAEPTGGFIDIFGVMRFRRESDRLVRLRLTAEARHANVMGLVHGGFAMALIDQVLFIAPAAWGMKGAIGGTTISTSTQFMAPLNVGADIDVLVELLRETGRMVFMRGTVEQGEVCGVSFEGTIRKASPPR